MSHIPDIMAEGPDILEHAVPKVEIGRNAYCTLDSSIHPQAHSEICNITITNYCSDIIYKYKCIYIYMV